ncbi:MAG TPA: TldD/PmbA family protein [Mycobacteriales bacterium]|jgi:predicted Zn-dependent protease|nr:TldD/PmbA family protein [Mycobacteriales bacterium]
MTPQETVERALALSKADGCVVLTTERSEANLRWAGNTLTTNGTMRSRQVAVISTIGGAAGVVQRSAVSPDDLEALVRASEQAARDAGPSEDAAALVEPGGNPGSWDEPAAETSIGTLGEVAAGLGSTFERAAAESRLLFGFAEHALETWYVGTSTGVRLRHVQPTGKIDINGKSPDYARSAWVGQSTRDFADVDVAALDAELTRRLGWADRTVDLPAGRYETLLPPSAVADLAIYMYWASFAARGADEGRTVFARSGGGNRVGDRLATLPITLRSDPAAPGLECEPFLTATRSEEGTLSVFDNGLPIGPVDWIKDGVLTTLARTRAYGAKTGTQAVPMVDNLIMESPDGAGSTDDLIARTERGLLLTCVWYVRMVDPQTLLMTGLTRDGVYLVEGGEVTGAVNNFRFNESPVDLLGRISEVGATTRGLAREFGDYFTRTAMPTLRIADFNMSTVSQAS